MSNLKKLRLEHNLKQREMAEILGITTSYYGMIEIGTRKPSLKIAIKIAKYFNISVEDIFK